MIKPFLREYGWRYAPGVVFLLLSSWIQAQAPRVLGESLDVLRAVPVAYQTLYQKVIWMLVIAVATLVTRFIWRQFIIGTARHLERYLRDALFDHMLHLPLGYFHHVRTGDLMAYAINDIGAVRQTFGPAIAQMLTGIGMGTFSIINMAGQADARLSLMCLAPIPLAIVAILVMGGHVRVRFRRVQELFAQVSGTVQENISGMRVIKAFAKEQEQIDAFQKQNGDMRDANVRLGDISSILNPLIQVCFGVSYMIAIIGGGNMVLSGQISLGALVAFTGYLALVTGPVSSLGRIVNLLARGRASLKRLGSVLDTPRTPETEYIKSAEPVRGAIEARNLSFSYPGSDVNALRDVSFTLPQGHVLGVTGPTGCGKSTLISLLMKFFVCQPGMLYVDDVDIRELPARALREAIGWVPQDGFLFNTSLTENLLFFQPGAEQSDAERACEIAGVLDDLRALPEGFATLAGERGNHLSGGQKQRVCLARALVRKPRLMLLDDALSAVDTRTEKRILGALSEVRGQAGDALTTIVVSHRLSAVMHADEILFMKDGAVAERGTHEQLMALGGEYAALYEKQAQQDEQSEKEAAV